METKKQAQETLAQYGFTGTAAEIRKQLKERFGYELGNANQTESWIHAARTVEAELTSENIIAQGEQLLADQELEEYLENQVAEIAPEKLETVSSLGLTDEKIKVIRAELTADINGQQTTLVSMDELRQPENLMKPWFLLGYVGIKRLLSGIQPARIKPKGFGLPVNLDNRKGKNRVNYWKAMKIWSERNKHPLDSWLSLLL